MKIVITGGPSSGKTALIEALASRGFTCMNEISRSVIRWGIENGYTDYFQEAPAAFSEKLWLGRVAQYQASTKLQASKPQAPIFLDRGIHDIVAYLRYRNEKHPQWEKALKKYPYDTVFLLPPWEAIYQTDAERFEEFKTAIELYQFLKEIYTETHQNVIELPKDTIENRLDIILKNLH